MMDHHRLMKYQLFYNSVFSRSRLTVQSSTDVVLVYNELNSTTIHGRCFGLFYEPSYHLGLMTFNINLNAFQIFKN